jgi:hypothetical protein
MASFMFNIDQMKLNEDVYVSFCKLTLGHLFNFIVKFLCYSILIIYLDNMLSFSLLNFYSYKKLCLIDNLFLMESLEITVYLYWF